MSHEIRTPLNAITGLNYLLVHTGVNNIQKQYLDKMQTASKNLLDTINDVLDFSKDRKLKKLKLKMSLSHWMM